MDLRSHLPVVPREHSRGATLLHGLWSRDLHSAPEALGELPKRAAEISAGAPIKPRRRSTRAVALTAAASLIIVALAGATVYLARELSSARDEITALEGRTKSSNATWTSPGPSLARRVSYRRTESAFFSRRRAL